MAPVTIQALWKTVGFKPNEAQEAAILAGDGPLYLTAGPGSGKTRVLLWRTVRLIVLENVLPERIFLGTFTEKGAHQLREGLRGLLAVASTVTNRPFDVSRMSIGTIHSNCHRILQNRQLATDGRRPRAPVLLDQFKQYRMVYSRRVWADLTKAAGLDDLPDRKIVGYLAGKKGESHHEAVQLAIAFFNRCAEEGIDPEKAKKPSDPMARRLLKMCAAYRAHLLRDGGRPETDLSLLQEHAYQRLMKSPKGGQLYDHVVIDEYQDTNTIQEKIYFRLAAGTKNLCVVGDDDQALYRFRGATVDNFLAFPKRCVDQLGVAPQQIPLVRNYRSQSGIVQFYNTFMEQTQWKVGRTTYRVEKKIVAEKTQKSPSVFVSVGAPDDVAAEVAAAVKKLVKKKRVKDPNEIAFLFPSLAARPVERLKAALEAEGLKVYAPRAGSFIEVPEALEIFGVYLAIFGKPTHAHPEFQDWLDRATEAGRKLIRSDRQLAAFVRDRRGQIEETLKEDRALVACAEAAGYSVDDEWDDTVHAALSKAKGVSATLRSYFSPAAKSLQAYIRHQKQRRPDRIITVRYVINRACSLDWGVLDLFYELTTFEPFKRAFDEAESGEDEGPICNLSLLSDYLARFQEETSPVISSQFLEGGKFALRLFSSYLYSVFRLGEGEYEDEQDPFPRGRIPFLTIHQAKGLEFPVVVIGNPRKTSRGPSTTEVLVRGMSKKAGEPLEAAADFDIARMFYVGLSRPKQLLIVCRYVGKGQATNEEFMAPLAALAKPLSDLDPVSVEPDEAHSQADAPRPYSFTGDYIGYKICPRRYMLYRRYGFAPSRSQTMVFGNLVHQTIEDLHQWIIHQRTAASAGGAR